MLGSYQKGHLSDPTIYERADDELDFQVVDAIQNTTEKSAAV